jgi:hypothetical protein
MAQVEAKYLKGLKFTGATSKEVVVNGKKRKKWTPFERALVPADVLAFAERGDNIVIVAADGQKHIVPKAGKPDMAEKAAKAEKAEK